MAARLRGALALAVALLAALTLGACVADTRPANCEAPDTSIQLALGRDAMTPNDPAACRGQRVVLDIAPEATGVFHIHGYDELVPATSVEAGARTRLAFVAERTGQFHVEFHAADDPQGAEVGIFTVHEP